MSWFLIIVAAGLAWFWWDGLGTREQARAACKRLCQERDVQFLDDTVALAYLRLRRDAYGKMRVYRQYEFEFTSDGELRYRGSVEMLGHTILHIEMDAYRIQ